MNKKPKVKVRVAPGVIPDGDPPWVERVKETMSMSETTTVVARLGELGSLRLVTDVNVFALEPADRELVFELVDRVKALDVPLEMPVHGDFPEVSEMPVHGDFPEGGGGQAKPTPAKRYECRDCGQSFESKQALGGHATKHKVSERTWRCEPCDLEFSTPQGLGAHRRYHHQPGTKARMVEAAERRRAANQRPSRADGAKPAASVPEPASFPDLGPIPRRPFDPQAAREAAADQVR